MTLALPTASALKIIVAAILCVQGVLADAEPLERNACHEIPSGDNAETAPLILPSVHGYELFGHGFGTLDCHPAQVGTTSQIRRTVVVSGSNNYLHDFTDRGVDVGVHLEFKRGYNTGGMVMERVSFEDVKIAWEIGHRVADSKCDTSVYRYGVVRDADYVALQHNSMAIQNRIEGVCARELRKAFYRIEKGGNAAIRDCAITGVPDDAVCAVYHFGEEIGSNQWTYELTNFKADNQCGNRLELVRMDRPRGLSLIASGCHVAYDKYTDGKYLWNLHDEARIVVIGGDSLKRSSIFVSDTPGKRPPCFEIVGYPDLDYQSLMAPGSGPCRFKCGKDDLTVDGNK